MWFEFFSGLPNVKTVIYGREMWQLGVRFKPRTSFPKVLGYKRRSNIKEEDIIEVWVYQSNTP